MKIFITALLLALAVQPAFANPATGFTPGEEACRAVSAADVGSTAAGLLAFAQSDEGAGQEDRGERGRRDRQIESGTQGGRVVIKGRDGTVTGVERKPRDRDRDDGKPPRK
jgi:hypothetical protein